MKAGTAILIVVGVAVLGLFGWLLLRKQPDGSPSKLASLFGLGTTVASGAGAVGSGVVNSVFGVAGSAAKGATGLVSDVLPWNW